MTKDFEKIISTFKQANLHVLKIMDYSNDAYLVACNETGSLFEIGPSKFFIVSKDIKQTKFLGTLLPTELQSIVGNRELEILYMVGDD